MKSLPCLLAALLAGGCLAEPAPVPLDLDEDLDEPFPTARFVSAEDARERIRQRDERTREDVARIAARRGCPLGPNEPLEPPLHGGPTFDRLAAAQPLETAAITRVVPPVPLPGLHAYQVVNGAGSCSLGWSSDGCYLDAEHVYCSSHLDPAPLARLIADRGLAQRPNAIDAAAWVRLLGMFGEATPYSAVPELQHCVEVHDGTELERGTVELSDREARITMPLLPQMWLGAEDEVRLMVEVVIRDGRVEVTYRHPAWSGLGATVATAFAGHVEVVNPPPSPWARDDDPPPSRRRAYARAARQR